MIEIKKSDDDKSKKFFQDIEKEIKNNSELSPILTSLVRSQDIFDKILNEALQVYFKFNISVSERFKSYLQRFSKDIYNEEIRSGQKKKIGTYFPLNKMLKILLEGIYFRDTNSNVSINNKKYQILHRIYQVISLGKYPFSIGRIQEGTQLQTSDSKDIKKVLLNLGMKITNDTRDLNIKFQKYEFNDEILKILIDNHILLENTNKIGNLSEISYYLNSDYDETIFTLLYLANILENIDAIASSDKEFAINIIIISSYTIFISLIQSNQKLLSNLRELIINKNYYNILKLLMLYISSQFFGPNWCALIETSDDNYIKKLLLMLNGQSKDIVWNLIEGNVELNSANPIINTIKDLIIQLKPKSGGTP